MVVVVVGVGSDKQLHRLETTYGATLRSCGGVADAACRFATVALDGQRKLVTVAAYETVTVVAALTVTGSVAVPTTIVIVVGSPMLAVSTLV